MLPQTSKDPRTLQWQETKKPMTIPRTSQWRPRWTSRVFHEGIIRTTVTHRKDQWRAGLIRRPTFRPFASRNDSDGVTDQHLTPDSVGTYSGNGENVHLSWQVVTGPTPHPRPSRVLKQLPRRRSRLTDDPGSYTWPLTLSGFEGDPLVWRTSPG